MKAVFEFNMDTEDDRYQFETMKQASDMKRVLWDLQYDILRPMYKHGHMGNKELTEEQHEVVDYITERFFELMREYNVTNE